MHAGYTAFRKIMGHPTLGRTVLPLSTHTQMRLTYFEALAIVLRALPFLNHSIWGSLKV
jgi:hypothetical protein